MRKRIKLNQKIVIPILVAIVILLLIAYSYIIEKVIKERQFANNAIQIAEKNEKTVFSVNRIELFSSANVIDNSIEKNLQNLNIYQYADISIYINNKNKHEELTNENTIKELYIDNINLETSSQIGDRSLSYTNSLEFAKNIDITNYTKTDKIDFDIIYTNEENNNADYSKPTFYTDCSNPITLKYLNKDIVNGYKMKEDKVISFDGKLLKEAKVSKEDIKCKIIFKINLVNNNDDKFSCWINFDVPLNNLYSEGKTRLLAENIKYDFFAM